jgi:hypothetical protein
MANNFPNLRPSFSADFVNGVYVDPRITFSRAGTRTYFGREVVKAEENLLIRSQEFNSGVWIKSSATIVTGVSDPFGGTSAQLMYPDSSGVFRGVFQANLSGYLNTATAKVFTIYAKASGLNFIFLTNASSGGERTFFDVSTGVVGTVAAATTATITSVGSGWYRCTVTTSAAWTSSPSLGWYFADADNTTTATTSGTDGVAVYGAQLEQRSFATAYTPTTTQPITRYQRQLKTAAANEWPREFDPVTGECLGRSVWESRTNLVLRSEEFDNASWSKTTGTVAANVLISPDGNLTADKLISGASSGAQRAVQSVTLVNGTAYTFSFYAKLAEYSRAAIVSSDGVTSRGIGFNLSTGATFSVGLTSPTTSSAVAIGNGWYRCSITYTAGGTAGNFQIYVTDNDGALTYTGDGTSGIYIWGAQLEAGAFATPYIPTVASQVTRLADSAVMTGVNFSSWFNPSEGALFAEFSYNGTAGAGVSVNDNTSSNEISLRTASGANRLFMQTSGVSQAVPSSGTGASPNTFNKYAGSYITDDIAFVFNGASAGVDTSAIIPVVSQLMLGRVGGAAPVTLNGYIKRVTYYPEALTSANLQAVTR